MSIRAVIQYVKADPTVFDDGNPRSWTDVSKLLHAVESIQPSDDVLLAPRSAGKVGEKRDGGLPEKRSK